MAFDPEAVRRGRHIASQLAQYSDDRDHHNLNTYRQSLNAADHSALAAFREHQLTTLIAQVEESQDGAVIRAEEAKNAYRQLVADHFAKQIQGASK